MDKYIERINSQLFELLSGDGELEREMMKPCRELVAAGGKRWRSLFCILCYKAAAVSEKPRADEGAAYRVCALSELCHTASLIHDDIEDASLVRRALPAAHVKYGSDVAINSACYLYFLSLSCIDSLENAETKNVLYSLYTKALKAMHRGQAADIFWHKDAEFFPSEDEYIKMCRGKTGSLAFLAAASGSFLGGFTEEKIQLLKKIVLDFALGFQIMDDSLNILGKVSGKEAADDLAEGKKSFVILRHLKNHPGDKERLVNLFERTKCKDENAVGEAVFLLHSAAEETKNFAASLIEKSARDLNSVFSPSSYLEELQKLCLSVIR